MAATFAELKQHLGDDAGLIVEAQQNGWTLMQAMSEAVKRAKTAQPPTQAAPVPATPAAPSIPPTPASGSALPANAQAGGGATFIVAAADEGVARVLQPFKAEPSSYSKAVEAVMAAKQCTRGEAVGLVNRLRPDIRTAYAGNAA